MKGGIIIVFPKHSCTSYPPSLCCAPPLPPGAHRHAPGSAPGWGSLHSRQCSSSGLRLPSCLSAMACRLQQARHCGK